MDEGKCANPRAPIRTADPPIDIPSPERDGVQLALNVIRAKAAALGLDPRTVEDLARAGRRLAEAARARGVPLAADVIELADERARRGGTGGAS